MSRIEEALRRAKSGRQSGDLSAPDSRVRDYRKAANSPAGKAKPKTSLLGKTAVSIALDWDELERNRVVAGSQPDGPTTSYKMLRTRMLHRVSSNNWRRIAITSARTGAGKTLTVVNAAISLAQELNQQIILVDLDLRKPAISSALGLHHKFGVVDYLEGKVPLESVVVKTQIERLLIIPNERQVENSSELLTSERMSELVDIVSHPHNSSIVLFDLPPLLEADDFLAFSPLADAVLLVVAEGETRQADLYQSVDLIDEMDVLGIILNKSRGDEYPAGYYG